VKPFPHDSETSKQSRLLCGRWRQTRHGAAEAGLYGVAIGSGFTILKSWIDGRSQARLEKAKAEWSRDNAVATELRTHVATVARELFAAQHSIEWLCSKTDGNSELTKEDVERYDTEIHATFPKLLGALATVSSLNERAYMTSLC
jgi:hypothetical protein